MCVCVCEVCSKSYKLHLERGATAEHFCYGNTLPLFLKLEKLIQISVLISVQLRPIQRWEVCEKLDNTVAWVVMKKGMKLKKIHLDMVQIFAEGSPSYATLKKWAVEFKQGRNSTEDDPRSGHPKTSTTDGQVNAIHCMVFDDRRLDGSQECWH